MTNQKKRVEYSIERYEAITRGEMDEGVDYEIKIPKRDYVLSGARIAILMAPGAEEPEILIPLDFLRGSGAIVDIIAPGWTFEAWLPVVRFMTPTLKIPYQKKASQASVDDYDAVILVGGAWNPAILRTDNDMLLFLRKAAEKKLPIFSICHGAQVLISAGLLEGRRIVGSEDILLDLHNAGAKVVKGVPVVLDEAEGKFTLVSSRNPDNLNYFCRAIALYFETQEKELSHYAAWIERAKGGHCGGSYETLYKKGIMSINASYKKH